MYIYIYMYHCVGGVGFCVMGLGLLLRIYIVISTRFFVCLFLGIRFENKKCVKPVWVVIVKNSRDLLRFCTID